MRKRISPEEWVTRPLRGLVIVLALVLMWLVVSLFWVPQVAGVSPPAQLLKIQFDDKAVVAVPITTPTYDFVDRPLFLSSRRPAAGAPIVDPQSELPTTEVFTLDGFSLKGVFSSEGVEGVMLKSEEGESVRLYLGQDLEGLKLAQVESRGALFSAPENSGRPDVRLAMELGVIPVTITQPSSDQAALASAEGDDGGSQLNPLSFEGMDAARADARDRARARRDQAMKEMSEDDMKVGRRTGGSDDSGSKTYERKGMIGERN